jgi:hypothetical protein
LRVSGWRRNQTFKVGCRIRAGIQGWLVVGDFREAGSRGRGPRFPVLHLCDTAHTDRLLTG